MARYFYKTFESIEAKINFDPSAKRFSRSKKEPNLQSWPKNMALYLTPQAMYNQFKIPSAGSVSELYYIYRNLRLKT